MVNCNSRPRSGATASFTRGRQLAGLRGDMQELPVAGDMSRPYYRHTKQRNLPALATQASHQANLLHFKRSPSLCSEHVLRLCCRCSREHSREERGGLGYRYKDVCHNVDAENDNGQELA